MAFGDNDDELTDDAALAAMREVVHQRPVAPPPPPPGDPMAVAEPPPPVAGARRMPWWLLAATLLVVAALGFATFQVVSGGETSSTTTTVATSTTVPLAGAAIPANLLGSIAGTTDVDGEPVAYPGELVTAPDPTVGTAINWQWELCPEPDAGPEACTAIGDATSETWTSPPTPDPAHVRVAVLVELDGVRAWAVTETFTALPERPVATDPTTTTSSTTSTTIPSNPYGDTVGEPVTKPDSLQATFALAVAERSVTSPAAGSNEASLLLQWVHLRADPKPGKVIATDAGYRVTVGGLTIRLSDFTAVDGAVEDVKVCVGDVGCELVSDAVVAQPACTAGEPGCPVLVSSSGTTTATLRATVVGITPGPELLYETVADEPIRNVTFENLIRYAGGWFVVMLPDRPEPGTQQVLTVTYSSQRPPDSLTIDYS